MSSRSNRNERSQLTFLQCLILVLSIYVLVALFVQTVFPSSPETNLLIDRIDFAICLVFIYDFFVRLYKSESKLSFLKWGWIGYGDKFPVTHEGRIIAALLMTAGVGLFGTFTAYVASYFLEAEREKEENEIQQLIGEVRLLREKVDSLSPSRASSERP